MKFILPILSAIVLSSCGYPIGSTLSPAWYDTQSKADIQKFWDSKKTYEICMYWESTYRLEAKLDMASQLVRRGLSHDYCETSKSKPFDLKNY